MPPHPHTSSHPLLNHHSWCLCSVCCRACPSHFALILFPPSLLLFLPKGPRPAGSWLSSSLLLLLPQLERKAKRTKAVRPLPLPRANAQVRAGKVCYLTGWGRKSFHDIKGTKILQEAVLIIQDDQKCKKLFHRYCKTVQICAGDPKKVEAAFKVCSRI